jgi:hypothetical protein
MPSRRFPPPWSVDELEACFVVADSAGQKLAYVYFEEDPGRRSAAKLLTKDEATRPIAPDVKIKERHVRSGTLSSNDACTLRICPKQGLDPRLYLGVERSWRNGERSEESGTQPVLLVQINRVVPIFNTFLTPPSEPILVTGEKEY